MGIRRFYTYSLITNDKHSFHIKSTLQQIGLNSKNYKSSKPPTVNFEYLKGSEKCMKNNKCIDGIPCGI
jgi:hypothetical protein